VTDIQGQCEVGPNTPRSIADEAEIIGVAKPNRGDEMGHPGRVEPTKSLPIESTKGEPESVPAVAEQGSTQQVAEPSRARRAKDQVAVELVLGLKPGKKPTSGQSRLVREVWKLADELAGLSPTPLIRSLAMTVALCDNDVRDRQILASQTNLILDQKAQACLNASMRRYLAACRALADARRLELPPIQVNLATNQVVSNG
jgi:hypothetical protein